MPLQGDAIWLPGAGMTSIQERQVAAEVEKYDADLMLGLRKDTGEWCVFLPGNRASEGQPFPVFTFGTELPHPDDVARRLYRSDVRRRGRELLDDLDRIYDQEQKIIADRTSDAAEQVAEAIASDMQRQGTHPFPKVHMGGKYPKGHVRSRG